MKIKKKTMIDVKNFYIANYYSLNKQQKITALLIACGNGYYDFQLKEGVNPNRIDYKTPLSKYINIREGQLSVSAALEISKQFFGQFNKENIGKPKWWEPKVMIADIIPHLKVTNSFVDKVENNDNELNI